MLQINKTFTPRKKTFLWHMEKYVDSSEGKQINKIFTVAWLSAQEPELFQTFSLVALGT